MSDVCGLLPWQVARCSCLRVSLFVYCQPVDSLTKRPSSRHDMTSGGRDVAGDVGKSSLLETVCVRGTAMARMCDLVGLRVDLIVVHIMWS